MTNKKRILLTIGFIIIAIVGVGAFRLYRVFDYEIESPYLATFVSPDGSKTAYLLGHSFLMGRTLTIMVSPAKSGDDIRWIGSVDANDSLTFIELVWSSNSALAAARCYVGGYCKFPEGTKGQELFTHGFDFTTNERLVPARDMFDAAPDAWIERDRYLEQLFTQNGGQQTSVRIDKLNMHMRKLKWFEWRTWRNRLRKAEEREVGK